ncbi:hypothetical protein BU24DRAFT_447255 [Aaosphaeria arxii CBS 175.79]|uniref:Jacalin-type lectin domain-containing protein n=1 Tax=Aaosphaeria arxii CBS 175.79 TaxID=1450172 RepID=A0A6A5Y100_9PLEO|nr:uncharacterized protein BU24DRAFT_447255 [Aaosphaeria arxii CBS 175.79]KAF2018591.1 hypothetical protein BU24DRAFT_447255 [Aaosphaeria arxii CBS 175.79]
MLFSAQKFLIGATALLSTFSAVKAQTDCDNGPWEGVQVIGPGTGETFCATKFPQGLVVTGIEVWADFDFVRAVQFYYSDGSNSEQYGVIAGENHARLDWDPATDVISQVKVWGNGRGKGTGRIYVRTASGKELNVGKNTDGQIVIEPPVNSGVLLGMVGAKGDYVDRIGFLFLKSKVARMSVDNVVFKETPEELNARKQGLEMFTLDYADHTNNRQDGNETFTFTRSTTQSTSRKYSTKNTNTFGFDQAFKVSGKLLGIEIDSTSTLKYGYANEQGQESSTDASVTLTYWVANNMKPGDRVFCRATAERGRYNGAYTATVNVEIESGETFSFGSSGTMDQVQWSQASSECRDTDFTAQEKQVNLEARRALKFMA